MKKTIMSLVAVAGFSGAFASAAHAEEVSVTTGDTLWDLSRAHNVSVQDIKDWNNLTSNIIYPNMQLSISTAAKPQTNAAVYTVQSGDTLWEIAHRQGISVHELKEWNGLHSDIIRAGQQLTLNGAKAVSSNPVEAQATVKAEKKEPAPKQEVKKEQSKQTKTKVETAQPIQNKQAASAKMIEVSSTAYTAECNGCSGITSTGINLKENPNQKVIAVDPSVIPLGSKVYVEGYGEAIAGDVGGSIKGNKIDVFFPDRSKALQWGNRTVTVKVLN
ncbi:LysM peptidoglycan-binding and 3D domain-containing protein [Pontibacillus litoralis]|uniref:LysM domain-containing protein n=1 Tax=Pontibacillus litoralis JSM 072002 TaxID=1385512 RepID=A0A0A5G643_9BACI|nr:3D domain-containing protein [Pontibacillus litoralis]KGX87489.1 hypothetical protein N784_14685 [Pontibacillus litoralis JSM 072002]